METKLKAKLFNEDIDKSESSSGVYDLSTWIEIVCMGIGVFLAYWKWGWHWFPWEIVICGSIGGGLGTVISLWIQSRKI